jgi:hypothetical protein
MVVEGGVWWCLVVEGNVWWCMVVEGGVWWCLVVEGGVWRRDQHWKPRFGHLVQAPSERTLR